MLDFFRISKGIELDRAVDILQGTGNPGLTSDTSAAPVGSFYLDTTGDLFVKQIFGSGFNKWSVLATEDFVSSGFQPLDSDLTALSGIGTTGFYVITGTGTSTTRTITGTTDRITLTDGDGVAGNPTIDIAATYVGQTSITTLGTITTGAWNGTVIGATFGGTGQTVYAVGDLLYADTTTTLSKLADVATGNAIISGGVGVAPSYGKIGLTTHVSGILAESNGGTNQSTYTTGDLLYASAANTLSKLAKGTANQIIGMNAAATIQEYKTLIAGSNITITPAAGSITIATAGGFVERFTFQADQFDNPVTANWAVNALAPASADTVNSALTVRRFDDTAEEGVGGQFTIPTGAVNVVFYFKSRAQTAPGATAGVQPTFYNRLIPDNAAVGAWSSALNLTAISIPTNANFQYDTQTISLASLSWSTGEHRQFELTRRGAQAGDTLTGDWNLLEMIVEFTT